MERLTENYLGCNQIKGCSNGTCEEICKEVLDCGVCPISKAIDKLAEYEQAEEDGLLIRLPCKVGEIIYEIQEDCLSSTIETIEFEGREYHRHIPKYFISMNMFSLFKMEKMGKTVFLTKAEAEAALAKMKGGGRSMREILFKAKRIDNGEWVFGNYAFCDCYAKQQHYIFQNKPLEYAIDINTLCQYTGLTDKRGNKIWENDVVKCVDVNIEAEFFAVVEFGNPNGYYSWGYQLKHIWGDEPNLDILLWIDMEETGATCEVIGNIFDNPELMNTTETIGYADNDCLMSAT